MNRIQTEDANHKPRRRDPGEPARMVVYTCDLGLRRTAWLVGQGEGEALAIEGLAELEAMQRLALRTGEGRRAVLRFPRDGREVSYDVTVEPLRLPGGRVTGLTVAAIDRTERDAAAARLEARDEHGRPVPPPLDDLWAAITERMGVCPSIFRLSRHDPRTAWALFRLAEVAYLDCPLPPRFKEELLTYLSRFCEVRYCVARHCAFLLGRGRIAGDARVPALPLERVLALLGEPLPEPEQAKLLLRALEQEPAPLAELPELDTPLGGRLRLACAVAILDPPGAGPWVAALRRLLGPARYEQLLLLLAFIRTSHFWTQVHAELVGDPDVDQLLREHEALVAPLLRGANEAARLGLGHKLHHELEALRETSRLLEEVRRAEELLAQVVKVAGLGTFDHDQRSGALVWSPELRRICGLSAEARPSGALLLERVHPEDRGRVAAAIRRAHDPTLGDGSYRIEHRLVLPDGQVRWLSQRARVFFEGEGARRRAIRTVGAVADITERKQAEAALQASEDRFRTLADNIVQLAWMADPGGEVFWFNRRFYDYTGASPTEVEGSGWQALHHPDHLPRVLERVRRCLATGEEWEDTFPLRGRDGNYRWFLSRAVPIRDEAGRVVRWLGTATDVTLQRDAEGALREAARRKDDFLAMLAHELRNPLVPIRNATHLLQVTAADAATAVRAREMIDRQVIHMTRLIDDMLDVSRITRGKIQLRVQRTDLARIVRQAADDFRLALEESGLTLAVDGAREAVWVDGDPVRLAQMVGNLLHNAAKFTDRGGRIAVHLEDPGDPVRLIVSDTGVGMLPETLHRLFEPFSQADRSLDRSKGGLGLGLALVKGLAELHGGAVRARSEGIGRGSSFVIELPRARAPGAAGRVPRPSPRGARRVLIVEDNPDVAESTRLVLESFGHEVAVACTGEEGLVRARELRPDVVLCDIGLPEGMDGYALARALRRDPATRAITLVALTGYGQEDDRQRARRAGFDTHLVKPVDSGRLHQVVLTGRAGR